MTRHRGWEEIEQNEDLGMALMTGLKDLFPGCDVTIGKNYRPSLVKGYPQIAPNPDNRVRG
jgi:hypothetical protein